MHQSTTVVHPRVENSDNRRPMADHVCRSALDTCGHLGHHVRRVLAVQTANGGGVSGPDEVVKAAVERLNANDLAGYYALMADDIVTINDQRTVTGKQAVIATLDENLSAVSDHWRTIERMAVSGQSVATWLSIGGTAVGSGRRWQVEGCTIWEIRADHITSIREYYDWSPLIEALGVNSE
jgi:ketosteroid isomerase-like protein